MVKVKLTTVTDLQQLNIKGYLVIVKQKKVLFKIDFRIVIGIVKITPESTVNFMNKSKTKNLVMKISSFTTIVISRDFMKFMKFIKRFVKLMVIGSITVTQMTAIGRSFISETAL